MRNKLFLCIMLLFYPFFTFAYSLDSILISNKSITQPCLIINLTSTDCVTCRAGTKKIIEGIKNINSLNVYILSDDKNMSLYFNKYPEIYTGFSIIYDENLSKYLALGPSSTVSLVGHNKVQRFILSQVNEDSILYIKSWILNTSESKEHIVINDSIINDVSDITFNNKYILIYNEKYQNGLYYDLSAKYKYYIQPEYQDSVVVGLYELLRNNGIRNLTTASFGKQWLKEDGVSSISVNSINATDNSLLFKLYAISIDTIMNNTDTFSSANPYVFVIGGNELDNKNILNINNNKGATLFQSIIISGDTLNPLSSEKHQIHNGSIFIAYWDIRHSKSLSVNGRYIKLPTKVSIVEFKNSKSNVAKPDKVYRFKNDSGTKFFFRISDNGYPLVVNNSSKSISLLQNGIEIKYNELTTLSAHSIVKCFDVSLVNDTVKYVAITHKNETIKGLYSLKTKKAAIKTISSYEYDNMKIYGNSILACKKNVESNELLFDFYNF